MEKIKKTSNIITWVVAVLSLLSYLGVDYYIYWMIQKFGEQAEGWEGLAIIVLAILMAVVWIITIVPIVFVIIKILTTVIGVQLRKKKNKDIVLTSNIFAIIEGVVFGGFLLVIDFSTFSDVQEIANALFPVLLFIASSVLIALGIFTIVLTVKYRKAKKLETNI